PNVVATGLPGGTRRRSRQTRCSTQFAPHHHWRTALRPLRELVQLKLARKPPHRQKVYDRQRSTHWYPDDIQYRELMASYYAEMAFIDQQIGRTMVVLTPDHGLWIWGNMCTTPVNGWASSTTRETILTSSTICGATQ